MKEERNYCVYMHIFPNGKRYIGITCQKIERRWRTNGEGYIGQLVYDAIKKYGWNNIEHKILFENLTEIEACWKEKFLIKYYNTYIKNNGYNIEEGGNCSRMSEETKKKLSILRKEMYKVVKHPWIGRHHTEETKKKIGKANSNPSNKTREKMSKNHWDCSGENNPQYGKSPKERMSLDVYNNWLKKQRDNKKSGKENSNYGNHILKYQYGKNQNLIPICQYDENGNLLNEFSCIKEAKDLLKIKTIHINGEKSHGFYFLRKGILFENILKKEKEKIVICEEKEFKSIKECAICYNINQSDLSKYLKGTKPMPIKFYDMGLRYKNETLEERNKRIKKAVGIKRKVRIDDIIFDSIYSLSKYLNMSSTTIGQYLNGSRPMPKKWKDRGLAYYEENEN